MLKLKTLMPNAAKKSKLIEYQAQFDEKHLRQTLQLLRKSLLLLMSLNKKLQPFTKLPHLSFMKALLLLALNADKIEIIYVDKLKNPIYHAHLSAQLKTFHYKINTLLKSKNFNRNALNELLHEASNVWNLLQLDEVQKLVNDTDSIKLTKLEVVDDALFEGTTDVLLRESGANGYILADLIAVSYDDVCSVKLLAKL